MKAMTYDSWMAAGFHVRKGERSTQRNKKGEAVFTRDQVEENGPRDHDDQILSHDDLYGD